VGSGSPPFRRPQQPMSRAFLPGWHAEPPSLVKFSQVQSREFSQVQSAHFSQLQSLYNSEFSQSEVDRTFSQFSQGSVSSVTVIVKPNETNSSVSSVSPVSLKFSQFSLWVPDHDKYTTLLTDVDGQL
jgi:hypothetical protein